jgi:hypothetical protein
MNTQEEIIEMARQAQQENFVGDKGHWFKMELKDLERFAKLVADKKEAEMQERIDTLHAMYEQACRQRDELMDQQRAMVAAMRGRLQ